MTMVAARGGLVDVLLVVGAWGAASVLASLAVGAVVARADRSEGASGQGSGAGSEERPATRALSAAPRLAGVR